MNKILAALATLCCLFSAPALAQGVCGAATCPYGFVQADAGSFFANCYHPMGKQADGGPLTCTCRQTYIYIGMVCNDMKEFPAQCDTGAAHICCQDTLPGDGLCAVPDGGKTLGICSHPLQHPPGYPNSSGNDHALTSGGEGHPQGFYNGCASGYADVLQTSGGIDAGSGCCSSVTKIVVEDPSPSGGHFKYVGEACDPNRGNGFIANGVVKDCCGGNIPLTCPNTGAHANTCCIPTGSAGPANSTGYADPKPGWCCSGYASTNGTNMCLASPDSGVGGCEVTGCGAGWCDTKTGNCTPMDLGEPCEWKQDGTGYTTGWTRGAPGPNGSGEPQTGCLGGFCAHQSNPLTGSYDPLARCCLDRDLQPALGTPDAGLWCHSALDCCTGVCGMDGLCGKAKQNQACFDDNDCLSLGFGVCLWQNGGWCSQ